MASTAVFPTITIAAGQQHEHQRPNLQLQPPLSPSKRFSLADFPMPPPLTTRHSEPTPGYWQKLLSKSSYAIRRKTFNGEGRTSNGGIERGDVWLSDDDEEDEIRWEEEEEEDGFCMVQSQRQRAVTMNPTPSSSSRPPELSLSANHVDSFRARPKSEGPQDTSNDLHVFVPLRFSSISTTSSRGHAKSRKNMHKAQKPSTTSTGSGSSGAASTIRGSTRTVRRVPSAASTLRMGLGGLSSPSLPLERIPPPPPIPVEHADALKPVITPRGSSLSKASRRELRSKKSAETSSRGH